MNNDLNKQNSLPKYIGIIMDGNGRWATKQNKIRTFGHQKGIETLVKITNECQKIGIKELTVFAFSTENWKREKNEVDFLMNAFINSFNIYLNNILKKKICIKIYGEKTKLSQEIKNKIIDIENQTKDFNDFTLGICFNYGSIDEIINSIKELNQEGFDFNNLTKEDILSHLYCMHPMDLIIRTGGEYRLSNFLLFQSAYAELVFTDTYWPDFDENELHKCLEMYQKRDRRFGGVNHE